MAHKEIHTISREENENHRYESISNLVLKFEAIALVTRPFVRYSDVIVLHYLS